jgi:GT2 family glycosyltransferase
MTMLEAYESIYAYRQKEYIERQGFSGTGNLAMRREIYDSVGPFAGIGVAEDREWGKRATKKGFHITYCPQMIVLHPARKSFAELRAKWDRHVAHDYFEQVRSSADNRRWMTKALALAFSPFWELGRILGSKRVRSQRERLLAFVALVLIRLHRAKRSFETAARGKAAAQSEVWNRRS